MQTGGSNMAPLMSAVFLVPLSICIESHEQSFSHKLSRRAMAADPAPPRMKPASNVKNDAPVKKARESIQKNHLKSQEQNMIWPDVSKKKNQQPLDFVSPRKDKHRQATKFSIQKIKSRAEKVEEGQRRISTEEPHAVDLRTPQSQPVNGEENFKSRLDLLSTMEKFDNDQNHAPEKSMPIMDLTDLTN